MSVTKQRMNGAEPVLIIGAQLLVSGTAFMSGAHGINGGLLISGTAGQTGRSGTHDLNNGRLLFRGPGLGQLDYVIIIIIYFYICMYEYIDVFICNMVGPGPGQLGRARGALREKASAGGDRGGWEVRVRARAGPRPNPMREGGLIYDLDIGCKVAKERRRVSEMETGVRVCGTGVWCACRRLGWSVCGATAGGEVDGPEVGAPWRGAPACGVPLYYHGMLVHGKVGLLSM
jgi:hypothetical protein